MRHKLPIASQDASQASERGRPVTITFPGSPLLGQEGHLLDVLISGKHRDVLLKLPDGKRIRIDACWTNHNDSIRISVLKHRIDFAQIQPLVALLEYLNNKQKLDAADHRALPAT